MNPFAQVGHSNSTVAGVLEQLAGLKGAIDAGTLVLGENESFGGSLDVATRVMSITFAVEVEVYPVP